MGVLILRFLKKRKSYCMLEMMQSFRSVATLVLRMIGMLPSICLNSSVNQHVPTEQSFKYIYIRYNKKKMRHKTIRLKLHSSNKETNLTKKKQWKNQKNKKNSYIYFRK